jgi:rubredoxin
MSKREVQTLQCAACGHVFDVDETSRDLLLHNRRVTVGGWGGAAEGIAIVVSAKGPGTPPPTPDASFSFTCPKCGRVN